MCASQISIAIIIASPRYHYVTIIITTKARESRSRLYLTAHKYLRTRALSRPYVRIYDIAIPEKLKRDIEQTLVE